MRLHPVKRKIERAQDELRRGYDVILTEGAAKVAVYAADALVFTDNVPRSECRAVISASRAAFLGMNKGEPVTLQLDGGAADTLVDMLLHAQALDEALLARPADSLERAALALVKSAGLLPVALLFPATDAQAYELSADTVMNAPPPEVELVADASAKLPLEGAEGARVTAFRDSEGQTHLALRIGAPEQEEAPLARVHSSCITGDILGSLRCDCGSQLQKALDSMKAAGSGVLLYLNQEGRGIGLTNKLRAYRLQDGGLDTVDANLALGFAEDERDFTLAAQMLRALGIHHVRLLANNPRKAEALAAEGIEVVQRLPLIAGAGPHNEHYLRTKAGRMGHEMGE